MKFPPRKVWAPQDQRKRIESQAGIFRRKHSRQGLELGSGIEQLPTSAPIPTTLGPVWAPPYTPHLLSEPNLYPPPLFRNGKTQTSKFFQYGGFWFKHHLIILYHLRSQISFQAVYSVSVPGDADADENLLARSLEPH